MRRRPVLIIATLTAGLAALALSGCYSFSGITLSKTKLKPGHGKTASTSNVKVRSFPAPIPPDLSHGSGGDVFFLLMGVPDDGAADGASDNSLRPSGGKFDVSGTFFNHPIPLRPNTDLRDALVSEGGCGQYNVSPLPYNNMTFSVFATKNRVKDNGSPAKQTTATARFKQVRLASANDPTADGNPATLLIATGVWDDDGDGIPETSDDSIDCTGGADARLMRKFEPEAKRELRKQLRAKYGTG